MTACSKRKEAFVANSSTCPLCGGEVPLSIIRLRGAFSCPNCAGCLRHRFSHEIAVKAIAFGIAFGAAYGLGLGGISIFIAGCLLGPLFIVPLWRISAILVPPALVAATRATETLGLGNDRRIDR
jgi:hypothetical protein